MSGQISENSRLTPSLLEPQSKGGEVADGGFSFQDHIILTYIPEWISQEGFTAFVKEAIGDFEAKFYVPGYGFAKDFIEVKNHTLKPAEFWEEIRRFQQIASGSPSTYRRFTLVSAGSSEGLNPFLNGLRRVQGSQNFYEEQDVVRNNSIQEYIRLVENSDHTKQDALFLLNYVTVETEWNAVKLDGEAIFKERLVEFLKDYEDLSARILTDIYNHLSAFVRKNINRSISRKDLEVILREKIPTNQKPENRSIQLYTAITPEDNPSHPGLRFDLSQFSGGEIRAITPPENWEQLLVELQDTRTWIENYRSTKRIRLQGNRRLPACFMIGSVFSAVRGYAIEMEYREAIWKTDSYATTETPEYPLTYEMFPNKDSALIVSISIYRNISSEVKANLKHLGLIDTPFLDIQGEQAITSPEQVNRVVKDIKNLIIQSLQLAKGKVIHLFYAGPAHLALFLGHRLDATAPVICYGWTGEGQYSRTCQLFIQSNHIAMATTRASISSL